MSLCSVTPLVEILFEMYGTLLVLLAAAVISTIIFLTIEQSLSGHVLGTNIVRKSWNNVIEDYKDEFDESHHHLKETLVAKFFEAKQLLISCPYLHLSKRKTSIACTK